MPAPLQIPTEFVKWRIGAEDLAALRALYGEGQVNAVVREVIAAYVRAVRKQAS